MVAAGVGLIFFFPLKSQTPRRPKKVLSVWFFVLFASQLPCCEYFVHQIQKFVGFFFCSTRMKLHNNNKNNKNKKQKEETERGGWGPSRHTSSSPSARRGPQSLLMDCQPPELPRPSLLLTGLQVAGAPSNPQNSLPPSSSSLAPSCLNRQRWRGG